MQIDQITPVILTYNEIENIARTLNALSWATRVIVLDSGSTDGTAELAAGFANTEVLQRGFDSHAQQWNFAIAQSFTDWVLTLDADYLLPEEFATQLLALEPTPEVSGYQANLVFAISGKALKSSILPGRIVLFKKSQASYYDDGHTQALNCLGRVGNLPVAILHDDRKSFKRWLANQGRYAELEVEKLLRTPWSLRNSADRLRSLPPLAALVMPFYLFFARSAWRDGWPGLKYVFLRTFAELILSQKYMARILRWSD